jgi:hypothetical protein
MTPEFLGAENPFLNCGSDGAQTVGAIHNVRLPLRDSSEKTEAVWERIR